MSTKAELRAQFAARRAALTAELRATVDAAIARHIEGAECFQAARTVLAYYPVRSEIDLLPLLARARAQGKTVGLPICAHGEMAFYEFTGEIRPGAYGIPVPTGAILTPDAHTLCLAPGYAYDSTKRRLGYGGGYYDRFLRDFRGVSVGVFYDDFTLSALPADQYDIPCDLIVTEKGIR